MSVENLVWSRMCRFDCGQLYREYEKGSRDAVWEQILGSLGSGRRSVKQGLSVRDRESGDAAAGTLRDPVKLCAVIRGKV